MVKRVGREAGYWPPVMEERRQEWCIGHCAYKWRTKGEVRNDRRREVGEWLGMEVKLIGS